MKPKYRGAIVALSVGLVVAIAYYGAIGYLVFNPQRIVDQARVWAFTPTAAVKEQVSRDDMTAEGKFLYLSAHPKVESKREFNQTCSAVTTDTSILGCYIESTKRIYLYHETDARLDGTEEMMAAHEMLRAAWDRMSAAQQKALVGPLHLVESTNDDTTIDLAGRMKEIRKDDPKDADAELYAIVGSEVPSLSKVLETNYAQYLAKRDTVTTLSAHSRAYLVALQKKITTLAATMTDLKKTVDVERTSFNAAAAKLKSDVVAFNARASRIGGFPSEGAFNVARQALLNRENALNAKAKAINIQIDTFNSDLPKLEALLKTAAGLIENLNIDFEPLPNVIST
ncbi:MAG TPA: hypothetical protein VHZ81_01195 [Galbitalea sp.]|nr:hypothetical protein [Galbitalea sp.]